MLCNICQAVFAQPRKLGYGTYYPWGHNSKSFAESREAGCHLCNIVWENRSYSSSYPAFDDTFPIGCTYAFKVLNPTWARHGQGSQWLVPSDGGEEDDVDYMSRYLSAVENDPTVNQLARLLENEAEELFARQESFWMVIDFYCPGPRIIVPLEIMRGQFNPLSLDSSAC
jgi:hypothetical protein